MQGGLTQGLLRSELGVGREVVGCPGQVLERDWSTGEPSADLR